MAIKEKDFIDAGYKRFNPNGQKNADFGLQKLISDDKGKKYYLTVFAYSLTSLFFNCSYSILDCLCFIEHSPSNFFSSVINYEWRIKPKPYEARHIIWKVYQNQLNWQKVYIHFYSGVLVGVRVNYQHITKNSK
jgi:hypothetical protein